MVVFKMRDSVPSASYSSVCNVLRQWNILLIPTYRVYGLYDRQGYLSILAMIQVTFDLSRMILEQLTVVYYILLECPHILNNCKLQMLILIIESIDSIIESVDSISRDERDASLTQYITNAGISRVRYTITHFKHYYRFLRLISNRMSV